MGSYINKLKDGRSLPVIGKAVFLERFADAQRIDEPIEFKENLVCVVNNGPFEAAGYAFDEEEMQEFKRPDGRRRIWLIVPDAAELSNYKKIAE